MLSVGLRFVAAITIAASTIVSTSPAVELDQLPIALPEPSPATSARKAQPIDGDDTTGFAAKTEARAQAAQSGSRLAYDRERVLADVRDHLEARRLAEALAVPRSQRPHLRSEAAVSAYMRLRELNGASLDLAWNPETSTPRYIAGPNLPAGAPGRPALSASAAFLDEVGPLLRLEHPRAELAVTRVVDAADGSSAIRYAQIVDEMPVWGRDLIVRFDAAGAVVGLSAQTIPTTRPVRGPIDEAAAQEYARVSLSPDAIVEDSQAVVLPVEGGAIAAWRVRVAAGLSAREDVFVRTDHLAIEKRETLVYHGGGAATGSGVDLAGVTQTLQLYQIDGTYFLINTTKDMFDAGGSDLPQEGKGVIYLLDAQNGEGDQLFFATAGSPTGWAGQENAVSASAYASIVYDYFRSVHNRLSIDDAGMNMNLVVNFGSNFGNAFWNGQFMVFGNGDGSNFSDLAGSLDVTAHEMSHGVIEHTANLVYEFEPGALNEHFADVFGVATDFHHNGGAANWLLGEDVTTPSIAGDCLRNMAEPDAANVAFNGQQPAHMNDFRDLPIDVDNGGVHINSGIPNRAFFLASTDAGMSVSKAEAIWYRALSQYLNRNSQFADFRIAIRQAAADLHGAGSAEQISVTDALNAVGMTDETDTDDPQDLPDNDGADFLAAIGAGDDLIYRTPLTTLEFTPISAGVSVALSGRPAFSDDGQLMTFVGGDQNVYFGGSDGSNVAAISSGGEFWSVALSADGRLLAATPLQEDNAIFVFDLVNPDNSAAYELTTQTSGDSAEDDIAFARRHRVRRGAGFSRVRRPARDHAWRRARLLLGHQLPAIGRRPLVSSVPAAAAGSEHRQSDLRPEQRQQAGIRLPRPRRQRTRHGRGHRERRGRASYEQLPVAGTPDLLRRRRHDLLRVHLGPESDLAGDPRRRRPHRVR